jgi:hypothetical protein
MINLNYLQRFRTEKSDLIIIQNKGKNIDKSLIIKIFMKANIL